MQSTGKSVWLVSESVDEGFFDWMRTNHKTCWKNVPSKANTIDTLVKRVLFLFIFLGFWDTSHIQTVKV